MSNTDRITMTSASNTCSKCNGSGKLGYRRANGVCFRCNGFGFISKSSAEASATIAAIKALPAATIAAPSDYDAPDNWLELIFAQP